METLISIFHEVRDPRDFNAQHDLAAMLFIALAATLCGAKSSVDIADFAAAHEAELAEIVDLRHGPPSHDSFSRVFRLLDPEEMARTFACFVKALRAGLGLDPAKGVVAVDGKRLRRGYERGRACMPPLMVSVWDAETRLSLATRHAPGGDEVAATLAALKSLVLKGCTVTGDALHCHPRMATAVRERGAHYAIKLKGNHGPLLACAQAAFAAAHANGKLARTVHYVVLSKRLSPQRTLEVTRMHWSVENQLHWRLDVVFNEDDARTRKNYGPENLAVLRRIALDILRAHPDNRSVGRKMKLAAWKKEFFFELFAHLQ